MRSLLGPETQPGLHLRPHGSRVEIPEAMKPQQRMSNSKFSALAVARKKALLWSKSMIRCLQWQTISHTSISLSLSLPSARAPTRTHSSSYDSTSTPEDYSNDKERRLFVEPRTEIAFLLLRFSPRRPAVEHAKPKLNTHLAGLQS